MYRICRFPIRFHLWFLTPVIWFIHIPYITPTRTITHQYTHTHKYEQKYKTPPSIYSLLSIQFHTSFHIFFPAFLNKWYRTKRTLFLLDNHEKRAQKSTKEHDSLCTHSLTHTQKMAKFWSLLLTYMLPPSRFHTSLIWDVEWRKNNIYTTYT